MILKLSASRGMITRLLAYGLSDGRHKNHQETSINSFHMSKQPTIQEVTASESQKAFIRIAALKRAEEKLKALRSITESNATICVTDYLTDVESLGVKAIANMYNAKCMPAEIDEQGSTYCHTVIVEQNGRVRLVIKGKTEQHGN